MKHDIRILILEDSVRDAELLERELRQGEIAFIARKVDSRGDFVQQLDEFDPDLIIADYKLPSFDGLQALEIVRERLKLTGVAASELRFELIGVDTLHGAEVSAHVGEPYEVRVRVAGRTENLREAVRIGNEVETLYTNGPAAGGGAFKSARDVVAVASVLLPRELARPQVRFVGA